jgi:succinate dehydrogenase/fumarate reductase cytochrome b subunit
MSVSENTNRAVFGLHGVTGMIIATSLLLSILVGLTTWAISVQQGSSSNFYDPAPILDINNLKANSTDNANFAFVDAKK